MIRILFTLIATIPIAFLVLSVVFDSSYINSFLISKSYYKGSSVTGGTWFFLISLGLYLLLFNIREIISDLDHETKFKFLSLFSSDKKYRNFEIIENIVMEDYRKVSNNIFPKEEILEILEIKGSLFKEVSFTEIIIIVKCETPKLKSWYSLHFFGKDRNIIFSKDRKSLKRIVKTFLAESRKDV